MVCSCALTGVAAWLLAGCPMLAGNASSPTADPDATVLFGDARFTVLTPGLIRLEWTPDGVFEDRASQVFINRKLAVPEFTKTIDGDALALATDRIRIQYTDDGRPFHKDNLTIRARIGPGETYWQSSPPFTQCTNLGGTTRTLDGVSGSTKLEPGLLTRYGWSFLDDSRSLLFDETTSHVPWIAPRRNPEALDWYFFCYGNDYKQALQDFVQVAGRIPLPPRFAFGAWWSRYWAYSDEELKQLVHKFREHDVPLDVLVVDMDWHLDGWTGYTWNPKYFTDPKGFLDWAHGEGLHVTLNLHPADGVGKHEAAFEKFARSMGVDDESVDRIPFDCTDPAYMKAYFDVLHRPLEELGVDFWWIDWQQGTESKTPGLDPLWWLNHLHWTDMARRADRTGRRPLIFSRWGGLGNHRYPIGFSGDTFCNWQSLAFQPYFTSRAGNVGFAYWSHDLGGHQPGPVDPELYVRWIQFGALSPILRTHTTKNPDAERRIWKLPPEMFEAAREAFKLRYELIPYIYTMARKCYDTGLPLCRPMYYEWPELEEAYHHPRQYMFGDDLLVAPVVEAADPVSGCAMVKVWLPPGLWTNWFTGRTYEGPTYARLVVPLDEIPLFARAGAIIPTWGLVKRNTGESNVIVLRVFPGESGRALLYEDDGVTANYKNGDCAWTSISCRRADGDYLITIESIEAEPQSGSSDRQYALLISDIGPVERVLVNGDALPESRQLDNSGWMNNPLVCGAQIVLPRQPSTRKTEVSISSHNGIQGADLFSSGFRGQFRLLQSTSRKMFLLTPKSIADAVGSLVDQELSPEEHRSQAESVQDDWPQYIADLLEKSSNLVAQKGVHRFLGIYVDPRLEVSDKGGKVQLSAKVEIAPTLALPSLKEIRGRASISVEGSATLVKWSHLAFNDLVEDDPIVVSLQIHGGDALQSIKSVGDIQIRQGKRFEVSIPFERTFLPSINAWWVLGPFEGGSVEKSLAQAFPPEKGVDLQAEYDGKAGERIRWRQVRREIEPGDDLTSEFFVDFDDVFGRRVGDAVAFAFCYLDSPEAMEASLALGSDDGVAVWLNGEEVHRNDVRRAYSPKQDRVAVRLRKGESTLLLKINQGGGDWGFGVHVEKKDGQPMTTVRALLDRPKSCDQDATDTRADSD